MCRNRMLQTVELALLHRQSGSLAIRLHEVVQGGVIAPFPSPMPPVAHAECL
jgi:hypothetical protein